MLTFYCKNKINGPIFILGTLDILIGIDLRPIRSFCWVSGNQDIDGLKEIHDSRERKYAPEQFREILRLCDEQRMGEK